MSRKNCTESDHLQILNLPSKINYCPVCGEPVPDDDVNSSAFHEATAEENFETLYRDSRESEKRLRLAFEAGKIGLWELDLQSGNSPIRSPRHDEIFGYDEPIDDWTFDKFLDHVHPDDQKPVKETFEEAFETKKWRFECRINRVDGELRWIAAEGDFVFDNEDTPTSAVGIVRDITEIKEKSHLYEAIFNQTFQFTGLLKPDGTLIEANDTALEFGGIDRDDVVGKKVWNTHWFRISEETQRQTRKDVQRAASGEFVRRELEVQGRDDTSIIDFSIRPVTDDNGNVSHLIPEGRDITELKEREEQLEQRTEELQKKTRQLDAILDSTTRPLFMKSSTGEYLLANREYERLFGLERGEPIGRTDYDLHSEEMADAVCANDRRVLETEKPMELEETIIVDGEERIHLSSKVPIYFDDETAGPDAIFGMATDITERKEYERQLEEAINAKNQLMDEIHHRVKNNFQLASSILGLQSRATDNDDVKQMLEDVQSRIQSMVSLHRILYQQDDVEHVRMKNYLESIIESVHGNFGQTAGSIKIDQSLADVNLPPEEALIWGLILSELLMDSFEHAMPDVENGTITVRFEETSEGLSLIVKDNGPGFEKPLEELTEKSLGLKLVKKLAVNQLGGSFTADGSDGACFRIKTPWTKSPD